MMTQSQSQIERSNNTGDNNDNDDESNNVNTKSKSSSTTHVDCTQTEYTRRAKDYDNASGAWHKRLAIDFVDAVSPRRGQRVLDLCCGTGLVTLEMARRVGPEGVVIGVDVTEAMLDVAKDKLQKENRDEGKEEESNCMAPVEFAYGDVTDRAALFRIPAVKRVITLQEGFDVISCCSALVLLPSPTEAMAMWADLLRQPTEGGDDDDGGRIIIDVPAKITTSVQYLATETLVKKLGIDFPFDRSWVEDIRSLERVVTKNTGLVVERSWTSENYLEKTTKVWTRDQGMQCFEEEIVGTYSRFIVGNPDRGTLEGEEEKRKREKEMIERARRIWPEIWEEALGENDSLRDGHWLYITIARRVH